MTKLGYSQTESYDGKFYLGNSSVFEFHNFVFLVFASTGQKISNLKRKNRFPTLRPRQYCTGLSLNIDGIFFLSKASYAADRRQWLNSCHVLGHSCRYKECEAIESFPTNFLSKWRKILNVSPVIDFTASLPFPGPGKVNYRQKERTRIQQIRFSYSFVIFKLATPFVGSVLNFEQQIGVVNFFIGFWQKYIAPEVYIWKLNSLSLQFH